MVVCVSFGCGRAEVCDPKMLWRKLHSHCFIDFKISLRFL